MEKIKLNKKSLLYSGVILIIALLVFAGLFFYFSQKIKNKKENPPNQPTREELIKSISSPKGESASSPDVSKDLIQTISSQKNL